MPLSSAALHDHHELVEAARGMTRRWQTAVWADAGAADPFLNAVTPARVEIDINDEDAADAWAACERSTSQFTW
jgi:hypothetical protein